MQRALHYRMEYKRAMLYVFLGSELYSLCIKHPYMIMSAQNMDFHLYADNTQLYIPHGKDNSNVRHLAEILKELNDYERAKLILIKSGHYFIE